MPLVKVEDDQPHRVRLMEALALGWLSRALVA
jgi:hypothetical protein